MCYPKCVIFDQLLCKMNWRYKQRSKFFEHDYLCKSHQRQFVCNLHGHAIVSSSSFTLSRNHKLLLLRSLLKIMWLNILWLQRYDENPVAAILNTDVFAAAACVPPHKSQLIKSRYRLVWGEVLLSNVFPLLSLFSENICSFLEKFVYLHSTRPVTRGRGGSRHRWNPIGRRCHL